MNITVIPNIGDRFNLSMDSNTTVGDFRGVIAATVGLDVKEKVLLMYQGLSLNYDDGLLSDCITGTTAKVYANISPGNNSSQADNSPSIECIKYTLQGPSKEETREKLRIIEPFIDNLVNNEKLMKDFSKIIPNTNSNQATSSEFKEILKAGILSKFDPDICRDLSRKMNQQLDLIASFPGGISKLRKTFSMSNSLVDTLFKKEPSDFSEISEECAQPDPSKEPNNAPVPNPWSSSASSMPGTFSDPLSFPGFSFMKGGSQMPDGVLTLCISDPSGSVSQTDALQSFFLGIPPSEVDPKLSRPASNSDDNKPQTLESIGSILNGSDLHSATISNPSTQLQTHDVNPLINAINSQLQSSYLPESQSVSKKDESLINTHGETNFIVSSSSDLEALNVGFSPKVLEMGLKSLLEMGFENEDANKEALRICNGNIDLAVLWLADNSPEL